MPTPHGSYYKQLSELLDDQAQTPQVGVVCETFSACISLVAKSDFLSILPEEMGPIRARTGAGDVAGYRNFTESGLLSDSAAR